MIDPDKERYNYNKHIKPLSSVMENTLKKLGLYHGFIEYKIQNSWTQLAGPEAEQYTTEIKIINNRLYIKLLSSALRQELSMNKDYILSEIQRLFNIHLEDIIFY